LAPLYTPSRRIMAATRGNPKLVRFALDEAKARQAELLVLFVRHLAVTTMGSANVPDANLDPEAQALFQEVKGQADAAGVPVRLLYAVADDVGEAILDLAVTHGVDLLMMGATRRGAFWRTMKGDVLQKVAEYLPEGTSLIVHA
jgi:nucleotide-binding universal stress UspA family protein